MRKTILDALLFAILACQASQAAQKNAAVQPADDNSAAIDQLAKNIFDAADTNHNHVLNKQEFANAEDALDEHLQQMAQAGLIGKPKKKNANSKDNDEDQPIASTTSATGNKLARSNKVSEAEFKFYVRSVVDEADRYWRQMRTATEAQKKAYDAARRANPRNRGRGRMPVPYYPY